MIDYKQAEEIVLHEISKFDIGDDKAILLKEHTMVKPYGWLFFYNSKKYIETGEFSYCLAGNAPILIDKVGKVHITGTAYELEYYLKKLDQHFKNVEF